MSYTGQFDSEDYKRGDRLTAEDLRHMIQAIQSQGQFTATPPLKLDISGAGWNLSMDETWQTYLAKTLTPIYAATSVDLDGTGTTVKGKPYVAMVSTAGLTLGMFVSGAGIQPFTQITAIKLLQLTLNLPATSSGIVPLHFHSDTPGQGTAEIYQLAKMPDGSWRMVDAAYSQTVYNPTKETVDPNGTGVFFIPKMEPTSKELMVEGGPCPSWRDQCDAGVINRYKSTDCGKTWVLDQYIAGPFYADTCDNGVVNRYVSRDCGRSFVFDTYVAGPFYQDRCDTGGVVNRYKSVDCGNTYTTFDQYIAGPFFKDFCDSGTLNRYTSLDCGKTWQYDFTLAKPILVWVPETYCNLKDGFWHERQRRVIAGGCAGYVGPWIEIFTSCTPCLCPSSSISSSSGCIANVPCCPNGLPCLICVQITGGNFVGGTFAGNYMAVFDPTQGGWVLTLTIRSFGITTTYTVLFTCQVSNFGQWVMIIYDANGQATISYSIAAYDNCNPLSAVFQSLSIVLGLVVSSMQVSISPWPCHAGSSSSISASSISSISGPSQSSSQNLSLSSLSSSGCLGPLVCGTLIPISSSSGSISTIPNCATVTPLGTANSNGVAVNSLLMPAVTVNHVSTLIVDVMICGGVAAPTITWGGNNLQLEASVTTSHTYTGIYFLYHAGPAATGDIVFDNGGSAQACMMAVREVQGIAGNASEFTSFACSPPACSGGIPSTGPMAPTPGPTCGYVLAAFGMRGASGAPVAGPFADEGQDLSMTFNGDTYYLLTAFMAGEFATGTVFDASLTSAIADDWGALEVLFI